MRFSLLFSLILILSNQTFAQEVDAAKEKWDQAKVLIENKEYTAVKPLLLEVFSEMKRPLTAYYLGLVYELDNKLDSAAYYYNYCIDKSRRPQLQAILKLIRVKMRQLDLQAAYELGLNAVKQHPDSKAIRQQFKILCQWAYMLDQKEIDSTYLSNVDLQTDYSVGTITHQELIVANIRNAKDESLLIKQRQYKGEFEIWTCYWRSSKETFEIRFNLKERDLDKALEAQHKKALTAISNEENSPQVRIGAMLALSPMEDKTIEKILEDKDWTMRLCACSEVKKHNSKRVKSICLKDSHEIVHAAIATMNDLVK